MKVQAYEREPYRREFDAEVIETGVEGKRHFAVVDDTIFYPEGGGQPADRGLLGGVEVLDVQKVEGAIRHSIAAPVAAGAVSMQLDWERRFDHMQQHTAQHVLTAVAAERFGWQTTSFHLGPHRCDIELDIVGLAATELDALEDAVAGALRSGAAVSAQRVSPQQYSQMQVRSRGLPAGYQGDVRLVEIADIDLCSCGGTHVANSAEIATIKLLGVEAIRGGSRLFWVAGARVRRLLGVHESRAAQLRELFSAGDDELVETAAGRQQRLRQAERRVRTLEQALAKQTASALASTDAEVVEAHFDDTDASFLQQVGRLFTAAAASRVALLTAHSDTGDFFVLAAGEEASIDLRDAGSRVAELLDGRGGGSGGVFQGKAGSLRRRTEALALLAQLANGD